MMAILIAISEAWPAENDIELVLSPDQPNDLSWLLELELAYLEKASGSCISSSKLKVVCTAIQNPQIVARAQELGERPFFPAPSWFHARLTAFWCSQGPAFRGKLFGPLLRADRFQRAQPEAVGPRPSASEDQTHLCKRSCWGVSLHIVFWCRFWCIFLYINVSKRPNSMPGFTCRSP